MTIDIYRLRNLKTTHVPKQIIDLYFAPQSTQDDETPTTGTRSRAIPTQQDVSGQPGRPQQQRLELT